MRIKDALIGVFIGNAIAGIIMLAVSLHIAEGISVKAIIISIVIIILASIIYLKIKKNKIKEEYNLEDDIYI